MIGIMSFLFIFLKMNDWEFSNITLEAYDLFKFSFLSPFVFYLTFSVRQFNHYKKQLG
jgi:hypothetical protein